MLEDGAYTRLLDWQYSNERPVTDLHHVYDISRSRSRYEKAAARKVFEKHFPGGWNPRVKEEIMRAESRRQHAREAINARWERHKKPYSENHLSITLSNTQRISGVIQHQTPDTRTTKNPLPPTILPVEKLVPSPRTGTPLPPAHAGDSTNNAIVHLDRYGQVIEVQMGRHRRLPNLESTAGMAAHYLVDWLNHRGFPAKLLPPKEEPE